MGYWVGMDGWVDRWEKGRKGDCMPLAFDMRSVCFAYLVQQAHLLHFAFESDGQTFFGVFWENMWDLL